MEALIPVPPEETPRVQQKNTPLATTRKRRSVVIAGEPVEPRHEKIEETIIVIEKAVDEIDDALATQKADEIMRAEMTATTAAAENLVANDHHNRRSSGAGWRRRSSTTGERSKITRAVSPPTVTQQKLLQPTPPPPRGGARCVSSVDKRRRGSVRERRRSSVVADDVSPEELEQLVKMQIAAAGGPSVVQLSEKALQDMRRNILQTRRKNLREQSGTRRRERIRQQMELERKQEDRVERQHVWLALLAIARSTCTLTNLIEKKREKVRGSAAASTIQRFRKRAVKRRQANLMRILSANAVFLYIKVKRRRKQKAAALLRAFLEECSKQSEFRLQMLRLTRMTRLIKRTMSAYVHCRRARLIALSLIWHRTEALEGKAIRLATMKSLGLKHDGTDANDQKATRLLCREHERQLDAVQHRVQALLLGDDRWGSGGHKAKRAARGQGKFGEHLKAARQRWRRQHKAHLGQLSANLRSAPAQRAAAIKQILLRHRRRQQETAKPRYADALARKQVRDAGIHFFSIDSMKENLVSSSAYNAAAGVVGEEGILTWPTFFLYTSVLREGAIRESIAEALAAQVLARKQNNQKRLTNLRQRLGYGDVGSAAGSTTGAQMLQMVKKKGAGEAIFGEVVKIAVEDAELDSAVRQKSVEMENRDAKRGRPMLLSNVDEVSK